MLTLIRMDQVHLQAIYSADTKKKGEKVDIRKCNVDCIKYTIKQIFENFPIETNTGAIQVQEGKITKLLISVVFDVLLSKEYSVVHLLTRI